MDRKKEERERKSSTERTKRRLNVRQNYLKGEREGKVDKNDKC